jgi:putative PEP-CTERM system TPR-repeat lipoprotein
LKKETVEQDDVAMKTLNRRFPVAIALVAVLLTLASCGGPDTGEFIASAKSYLAKQDLKAAIIQLRNARQKEPNNAEVRFLLGAAFLDSGDPVGAEAELRKALDLKYPSDPVLPLIARSLIAQGQHQKLATEFANPAISDPKARADIQTTVAIAALAQGDIKQAQAMLKSALEANPTFARAHVVRAQLALRGGDVSEAGAALDAALAAAPNDPEASVLKAELMAAQRRKDEAIRLLEQTAAANPQALQVRFSLVAMLVTGGEVDKAVVTLESMKKDAPTDFRTVYSDALVSLAKGDAAKARDRAQSLVATRPDHLPSLFLLALANYHLKNYSAAEDALQTIIARTPNDPAARRVLAATYLRSGRASQALETVETALRRTPDDPMLLRLAGEARIATGNVGEAMRLYERASAVDRDPNAAGRLRLAQIRLASGDVTRGLADLEQLSEQDSTKIQADLTLYATHLRKREYDKALAAVAAIEKKQPGNALNSELRGNVYLARYDLKEARKHFAKALEIEPTRLSSARSLAIIDLQEGKAADARARYEKIIAAQPRNDQPLIALAEILALSGAPPAEVKSALDRAVTANVNAVGPRLALVTHYRRIGDNKAALEAARAAATALPNEPRIVELHGAMQLASGEAVQARDTFTRLTQLLPQSPVPWLRLSEANLATRDYAPALDAQRKALAIQPDHGPALVALATTYLISGKPDEAIAEARKLQRERPKAGIGFALEAELLAAQKKFAEALPPMREAISRQPTAGLASRQYALLVAAGRSSDANAFADRWIKEYPKDAGFLALVGQQRQATKDGAGAASAYRAALEIEPDNVIVLNNLAWLLNEQGRSEARELAERAYRLAPLNASVVDTLGAIVLKQGDAARGVALFRQATNLAPQDPQMRLNLARALAKSGDKAGARREIEQVVSRDPRAPVKAEAEQLLREL